MTVEQRMVALGDFLTEDQVRACRAIVEACRVHLKTNGHDTSAAARGGGNIVGLDYGRAVKRLCDEIIAPALPAIDERLGQQNDPRYLAYAVAYVLSGGNPSSPESA